jgi:hypothetical protein
LERRDEKDTAAVGKESLAKTLDERYAEMSKSEKRGYWIFGFVVVTIMLLM